VFDIVFRSVIIWLGMAIESEITLSGQKQGKNSNIESSPSTKLAKAKRATPSWRYCRPVYTGCIIIVREEHKMRIPPYWAKGTYAGTDRKGKDQTFWAWGWSFTGLAAAKEDAIARARSIFDRLTNGTRIDSYDYLERPLREEIIDSLRQGEDDIAVITRNRYGALVLNSSSVCFADVDFPELRYQGLVDAVLLFFSKSRRQQRMRAARDATVQAVRDWAERNPQRSFRLYRTFAGLRLLFTDRLYDPTSAETVDLLTSVGSDLLYRRLTEKQECFRARLTPKPWRCGCRRPRNRYPWDDADKERTYREWEQKYEEKTTGYVTCQFVEKLGGGTLDARTNTIVDIHDQYACGETEAKLA
jgi:hypothetical protein